MPKEWLKVQMDPKIQMEMSVVPHGYWDKYSKMSLLMT